MMLSMCCSKLSVCPCCSGAECCGTSSPMGSLWLLWRVSLCLRLLNFSSWWRELFPSALNRNAVCMATKQDETWSFKKLGHFDKKVAVLLVCVALTLYPVYSLLHVWGTHLIGPDGSRHTEQAASPFFIREILSVMMRNENVMRPNALMIFILQWNTVIADQPPPHCSPPAGSLLSFPSDPRWHSMSH